MTKKLSQFSKLGQIFELLLDGPVGSVVPVHPTGVSTELIISGNTRIEAGMEDMPAYNASAAETSILVQANSVNDD